MWIILRRPPSYIFVQFVALGTAGSCCCDALREGKNHMFLDGMWRFVADCQKPLQTNDIICVIVLGLINYKCYHRWFSIWRFPPLEIFLQTGSFRNGSGEQISRARIEQLLTQGWADLRCSHEIGQNGNILVPQTTQVRRIPDFGGERRFQAGGPHCCDPKWHLNFVQNRSLPAGIFQRYIYIYIEIYGWLLVFLVPTRARWVLKWYHDVWCGTLKALFDHIGPLKCQFSDSFWGSLVGAETTSPSKDCQDVTLESNQHEFMKWCIMKRSDGSTGLTTFVSKTPFTVALFKMIGRKRLKRCVRPAWHFLHKPHKMNQQWQVCVTCRARRKMRSHHCKALAVFFLQRTRNVDNHKSIQNSYNYILFF